MIIDCHQLDLKQCNDLLLRNTIICHVHNLQLNFNRCSESYFMKSNIHPS